MPAPQMNTLVRALQSTDDASAASLCSAETHAELIRAIVGELEQTRLRPAMRRHQLRLLLPAIALAAMTAILVIALPGLLAGGSSPTQPQTAEAAILRHAAAVIAPAPGTLVIERVTQSSRSSPEAPTTALPENTLTTVTETSADGLIRRELDSSSLAPGYQQLQAGDLLQVYNPADNTIYSTTERALASATETQSPATVGRDTAVTLARVFRYDSPYLSGAAGPLRAETGIRMFRVAARTHVGGRRAIKLVTDHGNVVILSPETGAYQVIHVLYLTPGSYQPLKQVATIPQGATLVTTWSLYERRQVRASDRRLVSLTARHPHARIVDGTAGYLRVMRTVVAR